jgi:alpha-beta hydrolase superfamily lysophospholipase
MLRAEDLSAPGHRAAVLLLLPGAGSTRAAVLGQAAVLARHGYGALLLDGRGHGRSGGHTMDFGWWGGRDIAAAMSFLDHQPGIRPGKIALLGESMGGEQAIAAMGPTRGSAPRSAKASPGSSSPTTAG